MYRIIHSFLLVLVAVVAASLIVAPQPAWTTTATPVSATPLGVALSVNADGSPPDVTCAGEALSASTGVDIDPDCIDDCGRQKRECLRQARDRYERSDCYQEAEECVTRCFAGELDPDNPWFGDRNPWPGSGADEECETPADPECGNIRNAPGPSEDTNPLDGAESRPRRPHFF